MDMDIGGGALTVNPALDAARAEMTEIATNPAHPKYDGYQRGDKTVSDYLDGLYKKAVPEIPAQRTPTELAPRREPEQDAMTQEAREDRIAAGAVDTMLRDTLGHEYDSTMQSMRLASSHLFQSPTGRQALGEWSELFANLGPLAEVRAIRFLGELGQLIQQHKGA
jgi:hypothetical protein